MGLLRRRIKNVAAQSDKEETTEEKPPVHPPPRRLTHEEKCELVEKIYFHTADQFIEKLTDMEDDNLRKMQQLKDLEDVKETLRRKEVEAQGELESQVEDLRRRTDSLDGEIEKVSHSSPRFRAEAGDSSVPLSHFTSEVDSATEALESVMATICRPRRSEVGAAAGRERAKESLSRFPAASGPSTMAHHRSLELIRQVEKVWEGILRDLKDIPSAFITAREKERLRARREASRQQQKEAVAVLQDKRRKQREERQNAVMKTGRRAPEGLEGHKTLPKRRMVMARSRPPEDDSSAVVKAASEGSSTEGMLGDSSFGVAAGYPPDVREFFL